MKYRSCFSVRSTFIFVYMLMMFWKIITRINEPELLNKGRKIFCSGKDTQTKSQSEWAATVHTLWIQRKWVVFQVDFDVMKITRRHFLRCPEFQLVLEKTGKIGKSFTSQGSQGIKIFGNILIQINYLHAVKLLLGRIQKWIVMVVVDEGINICYDL